MKALITVAEIKEFAKRQEKIIYTEANTIITPAAKDAASEHSIEIVVGRVPDEEDEKVNKCQIVEQTTCRVDASLVARIVEEVLSQMEINTKPSHLVKEADISGLRLVKGDTVVLDKFSQGNSNNNVRLKEVLSIKESPNMATGFMEMEETSFDWNLKYDEINYVIQGILEVTINGNKYTGEAGDVFYIPAGAKVKFSTPSRVRFFFVTYQKQKTGLNKEAKLDE